MGDHGVNVSNDPLHTQVGDVTKAQNATFYGSGQRGGLSKRLGLRQFNSGALNAAVMAILSVALPDPTSLTLLLMDADSLTLTDDAFIVMTE